MAGLTSDSIQIGGFMRPVLGFEDPPQGVNERDDNQKGANCAEKEYDIRNAPQYDTDGHGRNYIASKPGGLPRTGAASAGMVDCGR